ncbi:mycothiol-dependent maleylpyruvate isomerase NagL [Pseudonocardia ailaonensis]|uniref:Mycothiol-dependent maleylpyruvate isomerase NagL n=1 Tax=Pseudonocardia ailaonensis TaxID=367279 RepID=A0ABN2N2M2_9PSEU
MSHPLSTTLAWAGDGAAHLRGLMDRMGDDAFRAPSALPGWSRAHVLTHVARNADAMLNLLHWARTGEQTPAYASDEARDAAIDEGASRTPAEIRADVVATSDKLALTVKSMPEEAWSARILNRQGREVPATEIGWMRAREMWIHSVDLDVGAGFADFPQPMLCELVRDVVATLDAREDGPALLVVASDKSMTWPAGEGDRTGVEGPVADLAAWLVGRGRPRALRATTPQGERVPLPALPAWL